MGAQVAYRPSESPSRDTVERYYRAMRPFWHPVLPSADLPEGKLKGVELLEEALVLGRLGGKVVALQDLCRHFQARLSLGEIREVRGVGACIMCPYHGWTYDGDGRCVEIPQLAPGRRVPSEARVPAYAARERYGLIWVCLVEEPRFGLPELPGLGDERFLPGPIRTYETWAASAPRVIMAAIDDTHGPWVHEGLVGDRAHPEAPEHRVRRDGQYLRVSLTMVQPNNTTIADDEHDGLREVSLETTVSIPNVIHFTIRPRDNPGHCTVIWQAVCPRAFDRADTFWGSARSYDLDKPAYDPDFEALQDTLREQDRRIVESQRPWLLPPFWTKLELPLRPADLPLIEYQRWLEDLGITLAL